MPTFDFFERAHQYMVNAHTNFPRKASKAFRKFDGVTPFWVHPSWCATTLLAEESMPEELRMRGAHALLLHDVVEDTTLPLPTDTPTEVVALVGDMTYAGGFAEECVKVWGHSTEVRLLKLYDKASNMMSDSCLKPERRQETRDYVARLCDDVERNYGSLNIVKIVRALLN